jgi:hypothetical protein
LAELQPGRHIFISHSGTWVGQEEEVETYLELVQSVNISEDNVIVKFSDNSEFKFFI